jgi:hypothetical protein
MSKMHTINASRRFKNLKNMSQYQTWTTRMRNYLICRDSWKFVENEFLNEIISIVTTEKKIAIVLIVTISSFNVITRFVVVNFAFAAFFVTKFVVVVVLVLDVVEKRRIRIENQKTTIEIRIYVSFFVKNLIKDENNVKIAWKIWRNKWVSAISKF